LPTGTLMGAPVSSTSVPRVRPSVDDIAIVRTSPPPGALDFKRDRLFSSFHEERAVDRRRVAFGFNVDDRSDDLCDVPFLICEG